MGIEKKGYKGLSIIVNKGIDKMANNTNNNTDNNNINDIYKYMFKTFLLRSYPLKKTDGREVKNWQKLPSYEWKKDETKTYHLYTHLWRRRSQELLEMQNCGVPCGKVNGIFVLDLDFYTKDGVEDGWCKDKCIFNKKYGDLNEFIKKHNIYAVKTISGGTHLYFKYDPRIKQTQNAVNHMDIRSDGGYVVSPFCTIGDNQYEIINEGEINEAPEDLVEFIVKEVMGKQKQKYKTINRKIKIINPITKEEEEVEQLEVDLDVYNFDFSDYILNNICKKLPDKFYHDREHHVKLATAFKTLKRQDIFNKWSKLRCEASDEYEMWPDVDDNDCEAVDKHLDQMWAYIGSHNQLFMVNHILNEAEANGYKNARAMLDYYKYKPVPNNPYIPHEVISHKKLGIDPNGDDFIFFNKYDDKYLLVQSDTGTGKTTEFKNYILDQQKQSKSWEDKGKFISIVSRVSLGKEQVRVFREAGIKCHYHEEISEECKCGNYWGMYEGDNIVITIDSLLKMQNWDGFNGYTIYLDEYNSLIEYLICVKLLNKKRLSIYNFLINMMRQADRVICTDADINDISIRYMDIVLNKLKCEDYQPTYKYIVNKYKHNNGIEAKEIFSFNKFIKALDKEDKYMICCDSKTQADIIAFLDKKKHKDYMLITADGVYRSIDDKWTSETPDLDSCDKVIFSPAVVYGLDSVMERPVYCYFKEHTISPCAMVQQLSRCRNIKYLRYLFCNKMWSTYTYHDYKQVEDEIIEQERYGLKTHGKIDDETGKVMDCEDMEYIELRAKYEYRNDCFNTNKYSHFIQIITTRGFKIKAQFSQTSIKGCKEVKEEMVEMVKEDFDYTTQKYKEFITPIRADRKKIVTEATNNYIKDLNNTEPDFDDDIIWIREQQKIKEAKDYDKWDNIDEYFNKNVKQLNDILKIDYDKIGDYRGLFMDPYTVQDHFSVCKYFKNDNNAIKEILDSKEDFMCNKAGMIESKMILLNKLRLWTKCKNDGDTEEEDKMDINNTCGLTTDQATSFLKEYKIIMDRTKWGKDPDLTDQYECQKLLVKIYKHLFGISCIKKRKSTKKGKSITYYNIDPKFMAQHDHLYQYRLDYKLRQKLINGGKDDFGNEMCLIDDN